MNTSLSEACLPLKEHLKYLFDEDGGAKALKTLIASKLSEGMYETWPKWICLERITFSREFVAIDFLYKDEEQPTIYIPTNEVESRCYQVD